MLIAILLLPALIAMAMLNWMSAPRVLVRVYLPCLMFIPVYMTMPLGGFLLSDTTPLLLLLCGIGLLRWYHTLKFTFLDACVLLFAFSSFYADAHQHTSRMGFYVLCQNIATCVLPYFVGRTLVEHAETRRDFAKTMVFCLAIVAVVSLFEYRMEVNYFNVLAARITGSTVWRMQTRWGFARIAGPYSGAINAGMIFSIGLLLQLWLTGTKSWDASKALRFFRRSRRAKAVTLGICLGLFLTQSRGPWIGCAFGLIIAVAGFAKDKRRAVTWSLIALTVGLVVAWVALDNYSSEKAFDVSGQQGDAEQQDAAYRRNLIPLYTPLIIEGGLWGLGSPEGRFMDEVGYLPGQTSIDNEYILIAVSQGYFGATVFVLILIASIYRAARLCAAFQTREDVLLAFCLLGAFLALAFTLTTVALIDPVTQIAFMLFGWAQSLRPVGRQEVVLAPAAGPFAFKRVFA